MPQIAAYEDVAPERIIRNRGSDPDHPSADVYPLIGSPAKGSIGPNAFLVRYLPGTSSSTHFHAADQMQIIVEGKGRLGHHDLTPYQIHFSRAFTPYGPLLPDATEGWAFINLRTRADPDGAQRLPHARDKLLAIANRQPFQQTYEVSFPNGAGTSAIEPIPGMRDEQGLRGLAVSLAPHGALPMPAAGNSDGQYILVVDGDLIDAGQTRRALAVVYVAPQEPAFMLAAGARGLRAMVLDFPRVGAQPTACEPPATAAADQQWRCALCDFVYDEAQGMPHEGVPPGTRWQHVPQDWTCPDCGATKADFVRLEF